MTTSLQSRPLLTPEQAVAAAGVIRAAVESGIVARLIEQPGSATELASRCGLNARMVELLFHALESIGAVATDASGRYVARMSPDRYELSERVWNGLPDALRSGEVVLDVTDLDVASSGYRRVVEHIAWLSEPARGGVVERLVGTGPKVLDVGAGAAPWSRSLAAADGTIQVTAVDLPAVLEETRRIVANEGLSSRFSFVAGDLFDVTLTDRFDLIIIAGVCRLFGSVANARLIGRLADRLNPGGTFAILDALPDVDRSDGMSNALYELNLALRTPTGGIHSFSSYAGWLYGAGLTGIDLTLLSMPELSLIRATRPG